MWRGIAAAGAGALALVANLHQAKVEASALPRDVGFDFTLDNEALKAYIDKEWEAALPNLMDFIRIPCLSPKYDPDWLQNGKLTEALAHWKAWAEAQNIPGLKATIYDKMTKADTNVTMPPLMLIEIPGTDGVEDTAFLYGHVDKQPLMEDKWTKTKPLEPLIDGRYLYGRGSADDGYALYASIIAVKSLQEMGLSHPNIVVFIEGEEESGSEFLIDYLEFIRDELNIKPSFMGIFDSGGLAGNDWFWEVTSMRGVVGGVLRVDIVNKGLHSGNAGGIVPSPYRIIEDIITSRLEDPRTGEIIAPPLMQAVTQRRKDEAYALAEAMGAGVYEGFGFVPGASPNYDGSTPTTQDIADMIVRLSQTSQLTVLGISHDTVPDIGKGGNVIQPWTAVDLSFRTAPGTNEVEATKLLKELIEKDPPYGANVTFTPVEPAPNFLAKVPSPWLDYTLSSAAEAMYGKPRMAAGRGGTVSMMSYFSDVYAGHDFDIIATGVLAPDTGHHGPDERLEIDTAKRITGVVANILVAQAHKNSFVAPPAPPAPEAPASAPETQAAAEPAADTQTEAEAVSAPAPETEATSEESSGGVSMGLTIGLTVGGLVVGALIGAGVTKMVVGKKRGQHAESSTALVN